ncbi:redoxin domain-containing protein [Tautonia rosea]|uniref:redoxin domain-containing protein n=1 Tax=Tautonia rosea TaxID=2728037 RepID=UPI0014727419|nr:redoxin domain-containing protein [Tautonia rosea]
MPDPSRSFSVRLQILLVGGVLVVSAGLASVARQIASRPSADAVVQTVEPRTGTDSPESRLIARGRMVYQVHCVRCHGIEGRGDGPDAHSLDPPVRDLASTDWRRGRTPEALRQTIREGIPGSAMAGLGGALSNRELEALVSFVIDLTAPTSLQVEVTEHSIAPELWQRAGFTVISNPGIAPPLEVVSAGGLTQRLEDFQGRWVLLHFWGTTCASCLEEMPALGTLAERFQNQGPQVLAICTDQSDPMEASRSLNSHTRAISAVVDLTGLAMLRYQATTLPTTAVVDPEGRLIAHQTGAIDWTAAPAEALWQALASQSPPNPPLAANGS